MQDDIKAQALRQVKVPFQKVLLKAVELFRFPALGRPVEVIQARFPDGGQGNVLRLPEKWISICFAVLPASTRIPCSPVPISSAC